jgi:photosystem II stability/assembly factor-like uncharacterized protein
LNSLVRMTAEPAGPNCALGGTQIRAGLDRDANGVLGDDEVSSTAYVCNGATGATGANGTPGPTGPAGEQGAPGATGSAGTNGFNGLVALVPEPAGTNCTFGGQRATSGMDVNRNGILDAGEVTTTTYVCNGATGATGATGPAGPAGPGVTWNTVAAATVQAASNAGYIASSAARVSITLPSNPQLGDIVQVSGAGSGGWALTTNGTQSIVTQALPADYQNFGKTWTARDTARRWWAVASSADGRRLAASVAEDVPDVSETGHIYTSDDGGATWTPRHVAGDWTALAMSADGGVIAAADDGDIHVSTDQGLTWTLARSTGGGTIFAIKASADGSRLIALVYGGELHISQDSGLTWVQPSVTRNWFGIAGSADARHLVAVENVGDIWTSDDFGVNWTDRGQPNAWYGVASSADGRMVYAITENQIHASSDYGRNWTVVHGSAATEWYYIAASADGRKVVALDGTHGNIHLSGDAGLTWRVEGGGTNLWWTVAMSADGTKLLASVRDGQLYTSSVDRSTPGTGMLSGSQFDAISLQYIGNNLFMPVNFTSYSGGFVVR